MANKFATSFKGFFKEAKQKVQEKVKSEEFKQIQEKIKEAKESDFVKRAKTGAQQAAENLTENLATGGEKMEEMLTTIQKNQEAQNQRIGLDTFLKQEEEKQLPPQAHEVEAPFQASTIEMNPQNQHFVIDDEQEDEIDLSHKSPVKVEEPQAPTLADQVMQPFPQPAQASAPEIVEKETTTTPTKPIAAEVEEPVAKPSPPQPIVEEKPPVA